MVMSFLDRGRAAPLLVGAMLLLGGSMAFAAGPNDNPGNSGNAGSHGPATATATASATATATVVPTATATPGNASGTTHNAGQQGEDEGVDPIALKSVAIKKHNDDEAEVVASSANSDDQEMLEHYGRQLAALLRAVQAGSQGLDFEFHCATNSNSDSTIEQHRGQGLVVVYTLDGSKVNCNSLKQASSQPDDGASNEDSHGRSGDAPGRSDENAPGRSGDAPGRSGDVPRRG
jgi:hypothetical protein